MKKASAKKVLALALALVMVFGLLVSTAVAASVTFTDVKPGDWYYKSVMSAVDMGLVKGKTDTTYAPNDNLTYAEAVKLAACMHQRYTTGSVTLTKSATGQWYDTFVAYAKNNGIIPSSATYTWNANATRAGYMGIFAHALPDSGLKAINNVPDNTIPDVKTGDYKSAEIYKLYRAGIVCGVDDKYYCNSGANIKRSEVAAIVNRMMDSSARISFATVQGSPLTITSQPQNATATEGGAAVFAADISGGTGPYDYQWHRIAATNGQDITLVDDANFLDTKAVNMRAKNLKVSVNNGDKYYCVITDANGNQVTSNKATLTVTAPALAITSQPQNRGVSQGGSATFSVTVSGGTPPYTYKWYRCYNGHSEGVTDSETWYSGATTNTLTAKNLTEETDDGDQYYCIITDAKGNQVTSNKATISVSNPPVITTQLKDVTVSSGATATFSFAVSGGHAPYTFKWYRIHNNKTELIDENISNANYYEIKNGGTTLTVRSCTPSVDNGDKFYCMVYDAKNHGAVTHTVTLTVK